MKWTDLRRTLLGDRPEPVLPPTIPLPMLPHAVLEFSRKAEDPDCGPGALGRIIETDSGLTAELLRYVNSATFGLRASAYSAAQAISMLGIRSAKLFLLSAGVQRAMKSRQSKLIHLQSFWLTNLERSLFAREVAALLKTNADLAYAGSMLQDFLLPVLSNERYGEYLRFVQTPEAERRPLSDYERATFGWDHGLATAQVLLAWRFPDDLVCCVLLHHQGLGLLSDPELGRTAAAAVAVAALIPDALRQSGDGLSALRKLQETWPAFDLPALAERVERQLAELSPAANRHFSLRRRLEKHAAATTDLNCEALR